MDDMFKEFEKLDEWSKKKDDAANNLDYTMVVPRVEDIIEERPLKPAASNEEIKAELDRAGHGSDTTRAASAATGAGLFKAKTKKDGASGETRILRRSEKTKKPKKPAGKKKQILIRILLALLGICVIAAIAVGIYVGRIIKDAPKIRTDNIYDLLSENSIIYDINGNVIDNVYSGDSLRTNLEYSEIPKQLVDAFVSIEDKTFWKHHGFNYVRMIGAIVQKLRGQSDRIGGTSTITQQLARNLYLAEIKGKRSMARKITEAYYTIQLEKTLSKEQIVEAYLNTIYLGFNCNGVAAASEAYFSKDVQDLTLIECAALASLPQSPNNYAPLKRVAASNIEDMESIDIVSRTDEWITYYNDAGANRINLVLWYMHDQGKIDDETYELAKADSIRDYLNPGSSAIVEATTSYFVDYIKSAVLNDLIAAGYDSSTASNLLYNGGLRINSTMDIAVQNIMDEEYENSSNFPSVGSYSKDKDGNVLDSNKRILLYNWDKYFNENGDFPMYGDEFEFLENGDLLLYGGKRLNFYRTQVQGNTEYSAEFKNLFVIEDKVFYSISGGVWNIPAEYKTRLENGDFVIAKAFLDEKPDAFTLNEDGSLVLSSKYFTIRQKVRQPQSAMVIMDHRNGHIIGMVGGRDITGKLLYNRATSPRQPGSSIKPISVYSLALQLGADGRPGFTAAMPLDDMPIIFSRSFWPSNWYSGYTGITNLRHAVEQSINACAVNLYNMIGDPNLNINQLQAMGITSLVTDGTVNDANASALALGGMTKGISPLEMTGAYSTFGNFGTYIEPVCYTTVTTKNGGVILEKIPETREVLDEAVASLMTDILRTTVTNGLGSGAKLKSQPSAGKTGTTSERYDIWFCGLTPQYAAATWIGNDVNIALNSGSSYAARLWAAVMDKVGALVPREEFEMKGEFTKLTVDKYSGMPGELAEYDPRGSTYISEYFIKGTEPSNWKDEEGNAYVSGIGHQFRTVCAMSGYLATPYCPSTVQKLGIVRPGGISWEKILNEYNEMLRRTPEESAYKLDSIPDAIYDLPEYYCPYHNPNPEMYPISPYAAQISVAPDWITGGSSSYYFDENGDLVEVTPGGNTQGGSTVTPVTPTPPGEVDITKPPAWITGE